MNNIIHKRDYCNEISILKLIFSVIVVLYHYYYGIGAMGLFPFRKGYLGVEFFFIVSGFLMMKKIDTTDIGAKRYTINKAKRIYPHFIIALTMMFLLRLVGIISKEGFAVKNIALNFIRYILEALFLVEIRLPFNDRLLGQAWYISAMVIVGFFMFYILRRAGKQLVWLLFLLSGVFIFMSFKQYGDFHLNFQYLNIYKGFGLYYGLIRGFCGMSMGCTAYVLAGKLKTVSGAKALALKIADLAVLIAILMIICIGTIPDMDYVVIALIFVLVTLTFAKQSFFANIYDCINIRKIEEFSLAIYMYYIIVVVTQLSYLKIHNIYLYFALTMLLSVIMIFVVRKIQESNIRK